MNLPDINENSNFFSDCTVYKTLRPYDPGAKKYRAKAAILVGPGKLVKVRHYRNPDGETRKTIEVEI